MSSFDRRNTYQFWTKSLLYDTSHSHKINIAIALMLRVLNSNNPTFWCWCTKINHNLVENYNYIPQEEFSYLNIHLNANSNIAEKINCKLARVFWIGVKEQELDLQVKIVNKCCMRQWALTLAHMATGWSLVTPGLGLIWLDIGLVHQAQAAQPSQAQANNISGGGETWLRCFINWTILGWSRWRAVTCIHVSTHFHLILPLCYICRNPDRVSTPDCLDWTFSKNFYHENCH